jgi:hypothetical protein
MKNDALILESIYKQMYSVIEEDLALAKKNITDKNGDTKFLLVVTTNQNGETFKKKDAIKKTGLFSWDGANLRAWVSKPFNSEEELRKEAPRYVKAIYTLNKTETPLAETDFEDIAGKLEDAIDEGMQDKITSFLDELKEKIKTDANSPDVQEFFNFRKKFRRYSFANQMLIFIQKKNATHVAGKLKWIKDFNRQLKKGAKGIYIYVPISKKMDQDESDAAQDQDVVRQTRFILKPVFDISDTEQIEGKENKITEEPKWFDEATPDEKTRVIYDALVEFAKSRNIQVNIEGEKTGHARGYSSMGTIGLKAENISTLVHEIAHEIIHGPEERMEGDKKILELQAEGVAYVVLREFDLPHEHASKYLALWKIDPQHVTENEKVIATTARTLIDYIYEYANKQDETPEQEQPEVKQESFKNFFSKKLIAENDSPTPTYKVKDKDKNIIGKALEEAGLDGNGRFGNPSKGVAVLAKALHTVGFELDMVRGDILLGANGQRNLSYRKYDQKTGTFDEHPVVTNSTIAFNWHYQGKDHNDDPMFEIQCYAS